MSSIKSIQPDDFAKLFGTTTDDFDSKTRAFIAEHDFRYRTLDGIERDNVILTILKQIDSGTFQPAGKNRKPKWEKGWKENLDSFIESGYNLSALIPKYVRPDQVLRLYKDYVMPCDPNMEFNFFTVLRLWLFKKYLKDFDRIYEFGCGTGYNLTLIDDIFPDKIMRGFDWSEASIRILDLLREIYGMKVHGQLFDMYSPDYKVYFDEHCAVFTIGALEQLGSNHHEFMKFLMDAHPGLCIHLEPILEFYDENNLVDYLAIRFHKHRNYLDSFLPALQAQGKENKIKIIETNRMQFGSMFHDGWSMTVWGLR